MDAITLARHTSGEGVEVGLIKSHSTAAKAGIKVGDRLLRVNGANVLFATQSQALDAAKRAGTGAVTIAVSDVVTAQVCCI